jgi:hypothetical protein
MLGDWEILVEANCRTLLLLIIAEVGRLYGLCRFRLSDGDGGLGELDLESIENNFLGRLCDP